MIRVYAKEFSIICKFLLDSKEDVFMKDTRIIVKRELLESLLAKNNYEEVPYRLKIWRKLGWIEADPKHLTKRIHIKERGGYQRMYVLKKDIYEVLCEIEENKTS